MKPLHELSADELAGLSDDEFIDQVISAIEAYSANRGRNLRLAHLRLARSVEMGEVIEALWKEAPPPKPTPKVVEAPKAPQSQAGLGVSREANSLKGFKRRDLSALAHRPVLIEAKAAEIKSEDMVSELAAKASVGIPRTKSANKVVYSKALVAPEGKAKALVKFNPIKNPYNQNGFENARIALDMMKFECGLDLFHNKPVIMGEHAWLGSDGFEDFDNVVLKLRQIILDEFGFDTKSGLFDALKARCLDNAFDPVVNYLDRLQWDGKGRLDTWLMTKPIKLMLADGSHPKT